MMATTMTACQNLDDQKVWEHDETLTLIEIMKTYYKSLNTAKSPMQKGKVWQSIRDEFSAICPDTCRSDKAIRKR